MKNIKKKIGTVGAMGLISVLSLGGLSPALAADPPFTNPQEYKNSMTVDGSVSVDSHNDVNGDGMVNEGDTFDLNLHIENTSDKDYNYVDVSSYGLELDRVLVSDSLSAGESVDFPLTYTVKKSDEYTGNIYHNLFVNVRDETRLENSEEVDVDLTVDVDDSLISLSNDKKIAGVILNQETNKFVVSSLDDYDNYYGIDESRIVEDWVDTKVGDGYTYAFSFTNTTDEAITLDKLEYVDNVIEENASGTVVEPGETANLYVVSEITREDLDWGLSETKANVAGSTDLIISDSNGNLYSIQNGVAKSSTSPSSFMSWADVDKKDLGETAEINASYSYSTEANNPTLVVAGFVSERFGFINASETVVDDNTRTVNAPESVILQSGESFEDNAYLVAYGRYNSYLTSVRNLQLNASYENNTGGGIGDEFPPPTLSDPVCDEEAQVVLPQEFIDAYNEEHYSYEGAEEITYEVERQGDSYYVYVVDWNYPMVITEFDLLEIPAVVPCPVDPPVEIPEPEAPTFTSETCDDEASVKVPENNEYYTYEASGSQAHGEAAYYTVNAVSVETGEIVKTWEFESVPVDEATCNPVVEIPEPEAPTFTPETCDDEESLNVPDDNEYYTYNVIGVQPYNEAGVWEVEAVNVETGETAGHWMFDVPLFDSAACETPVVPENPVDPPVVDEPVDPENPVDPPVVIDEPEKPIVPEKIIQAGDMVEASVKENTSAYVIALISGIVVMLGIGGVSVYRLKKKQ